MLDKLINTFFTSDFTMLVLSKKVIVQSRKSGVASSFSKDVVLEYDYKSDEDLRGLFDQIKKTLNPQPTDHWFLGLPLKYFTLVNFSLPAAAMENLDEAVRYSLMRHVPYDLDQARINFQIKEKGDFLDISAVVIPKASLRPFLKAAGSQNITFYNVFPSIVYWSRLMGDGIYVSYGPDHGEALVYQNDKIIFQTWATGSKQGAHFLQETSRLLANISDLPSTFYLLESSGKKEDIIEKLKINPQETEVIGFNSMKGSIQNGKSATDYKINLLPPAVLRQKMFAKYMVFAGMIFFALSLFVLPVSKLAGQKRHLSKIENRLQEISRMADDLNHIREESRLIMDSVESMAEMKKSYPSTINILSELTQVIPETAWAISLNYANNKITMQGEADSATSVIEAIENSPMFREVRFSSPVTKSGPRDRFTLEAEVVS